MNIKLSKSAKKFLQTLDPDFRNSVIAIALARSSPNPRRNFSTQYGKDYDNIVKASLHKYSIVFKFSLAIQMGRLMGGISSDRCVVLTQAVK